MDVQIDEVHSTIRTTDGQELLSPQVLQQIVKAVLERLRAEMEHERCVQSESELQVSKLMGYM
jgi:hypothetical protein